MLDALPLDLLATIVRQDVPDVAPGLLGVSRALHSNTKAVLQAVTELTFTHADQLVLQEVCEVLARCLPCLASLFFSWHECGMLVRIDTRMLRAASHLNFTSRCDACPVDIMDVDEEQHEEKQDLLATPLALICGPFLRQNPTLVEVNLGMTRVDVSRLRRGFVGGPRTTAADRTPPLRWEEFERPRPEYLEAASVAAMPRDAPLDDAAAILTAELIGAPFCTVCMGGPERTFVRLKLTGRNRVVGSALARCEHRNGGRLLFLSDERKVGPALMLEALSPSSLAALELRSARAACGISYHGFGGGADDGRAQPHPWQRRLQWYWPGSCGTTAIGVAAAACLAVSLRLSENEWAKEHGYRKGALISAHPLGESPLGRVGDLGGLLDERIRRWHALRQEAHDATAAP